MNGILVLVVTTLRRIDLLLTDVVLPGSTGFGLAASLRGTRPDLQVLFVTGYVGHSALDGPRVPADSDFLWKPFNGEDLAAAIRGVFERGAAAATRGH